MFSIDEGGRASLIDATSKTGGTAVCPNHTIRANTRFIIGRLSVRSLPRLKSQRGACKRFPRLFRVPAAPLSCTLRPHSAIFVVDTASLHIISSTDIITYPKIEPRRADSSTAAEIERRAFP